MPFGFSLTDLLLELSSIWNGPSQNVQHKLQKTPPAPGILDDPKVRDHLIRRDTNISTVLTNSYENLKVWFMRQEKYASDLLHSATELDEQICATSDVVMADFIDKDGSPAVTPNSNEAVKGTDKSTSSSSGLSEEEADDGKSSTTDSHCSRSTTWETNSSGCDRSDWAPLRAIPHWDFHKILAQHVGGSLLTEDEDYQFCKEIEGGFNYVRIYNLLTGPNAGTYVIKVPSVGTSLGWQKQDAYMLRSEFGTIKLIRERTKCPVPEVIAYSDTLDNDLGAPYILMKACQGRCALDVWYGVDSDGRFDLEKSDRPSAALASKRSRMLRSLAQAMAELRNLEFDKIGALNFDEVDMDGMPTIGPVWLWNVELDSISDMFTEKALAEKPVYDSSLELLMDGLEKAWPREGKEGRLLAMHGILDTFFRSDAFSKPAKPECSKETFVLRHDDLNLQNIFCDPDTGEVTAIIDWERASTAPRCLGYSTLPLWLTYDWLPDYDVYDQMHSPLSLQMYREIYADAMIKATGADGDGVYTSKSAMYQAAYAALFGGQRGGNVSDFVRKMLRQVPGVRHTDLEMFLTWMGENWEEVEDTVKQAIRKAAKPCCSYD
ncbi:hypothetical protein ACET3X_007162 [Alternaria dauci]|uniref:Aminoglycoside phosphotransferase domain-containing protein n=1 Tax=Alternaria dauci TaxID=48095 RepID=A0ABR3UFT9_9PLEO